MNRAARLSPDFHIQQRNLWVLQSTQKLKAALLVRRIKTFRGASGIFWREVLLRICKTEISYVADKYL